MELIKRYVYAVTSNLARSQREEVARELSASIEDMARDKSGGRKPSEKHVRAVLEELGDPIVVAQQYRGASEYLIGPSLYYQYLWLLKKVFMFALPIYTLVFAITHDYAFPLHIGSVIGNWIEGLFTVILHVLFWVTAMFFVLEKTGVKVEQINSDQQEWSVDSLPELPRATQIDLVDTISSMFFYASLIVGGIVLWRFIDQGSNLVATFFNSQITQSWIPILIFLGVVGIAVEIVKLVVGNWSRLLMVIALALNALFVGYMVAVASSGQDILNPSLGDHTHRIAAWSIGITVVIFILSYAYDSYKIIKSARSSHE